MAQKIDWGNIDTILLDMDGTLLDLHFDLHFWMEYMPLVFAKKHNITCDEAKDKLYIAWQILRQTVSHQKRCFLLYQI
jgi:putative hydrolase of the HAD superfamily